MARKYYTICIREDGVWAQQFGDYDKSVAIQEAIDSYTRDCNGNRILAKDRKVITTGDRQFEIGAAICALNTPAVEDGCLID